MNSSSSNPGKAYCHHDAVVFISMWTGLDAGLVGQVLDAKVRYLELIGIIATPMDADLQSEQEKFKHLLPETPNFLDERQNEYLSLVTGLDEKTVLLVGQGDMAYIDSLGLVDWDSEAERDAALGSPSIPEGESSESPIDENHGEQLACLVADFDSYSQRRFSSAPDRLNLQFQVPSPIPRWDDVTAYATPESANLTTWRLDGNKGHRHEIICGYPVAKDGTIHTLTHDRCRVWEFQCEATLYATLPSGLSLAYYDTAHQHPLNFYVKGEANQVRLSGFCLSLGPAPTKVHVVTQEQQVRALRAFQGGVQLDQVTNLSPFKLDPEKTSFMLPRQEGNPDEYLFQGPVVDMDVLEAWDHILYRLEVILFYLPLGDKKVPFIVPFYVAKKCVKAGYKPHLGDFVSGFLWLQGIRQDLPLPWPPLP